VGTSLYIVYCGKNTHRIKLATFISFQCTVWWYHNLDLGCLPKASVLKTWPQLVALLEGMGPSAGGA
jgi:hypothetical protein